MPSKSPEQASLMRAVAHGWNKPGGGGPSRAVAREFVNADKGMYTGGLAAMNLQEGGEVYDPYYGRDPNAPTPSKDEQKWLDMDLRNAKGFYGKMFSKLQAQLRAKYNMGDSGFASDAPPIIQQPPTYGGGPRGRGPRGRGGRRVPPGVTPPGPAPGNEVPPGRIVPTDVTPFIPPDRRRGRDTQYSQQLSEHKDRIAAILGNAKGGPVRYQEGGAARPGHAEGPNPYPPGSARYKLWERKNHRDPAPPPAAKEDDGGLFARLFGGAEKVKGRSEEELERLGEARGGYQNFQYGGLAQAAGRPPMRGGMPPPTRGGMPPRGMPPGMDPRRSGPKLQMPPTDGGAGIPGGARVPPNMRGHLQKMRMQNRPPPGPVGGGQNRVGQQDQQGGLARALQRGTGRPPMSRRSAFPGR